MDLGHCWAVNAARKELNVTAFPYLQHVTLRTCKPKDKNRNRSVGCSGALRLLGRMEERQNFCSASYRVASGRAVWGVGLLPIACWDCGFESRLGHGCLALVIVVRCQIQVSASGWSLVQRSPTDCGVSEYEREASTTRSSLPIRGCLVMVRTLLILSSTCIVQGVSKMRDLRFLVRC